MTEKARYVKVSNLSLLTRFRRQQERRQKAIAAFDAKLRPYRAEIDRRAREAHPFVLVHRAVPGSRYCISGWWPDDYHTILVNEIDRPEDAPAGMPAHANLHEFIVTTERLTGR
jgi:hypothetical protein